MKQPKVLQKKKIDDLKTKQRPNDLLGDDPFIEYEMKKSLEMFSNKKKKLVVDDSDEDIFHRKSSIEKDREISMAYRTNKYFYHVPAGSSYPSSRLGAQSASKRTGGESPYKYSEFDNSSPLLSNLKDNVRKYVSTP